MCIDLKKILWSALFAALAVPMSLGYASDVDDRRGGFWKALEPSVDREETVVVSMATDPREDAEPACVALQIGMNLLMSDLNGDEPGGKVTPADSVILFLTLDGVELVANDLAGLECLTPSGISPLAGLLSKFVNVLEGEVVVCPLCWSARGYGPTGDDPKSPTYGIVADAFDIHDLFLYADKVIGF